MTLTSAEKQQRYRERHLGIHGTKERIQQSANAERALLKQASARQRTAYLDGHHQHSAG